MSDKTRKDPYAAFAGIDWGSLGDSEFSLKKSQVYRVAELEGQRRDVTKKARAIVDREVVADVD